MATKMIASAGVLLLLRFIVQFIWGVQPRLFELDSTPFQLGPFRMNWVELTIVIVAVVSVLGFVLLMKVTSLGRNLRAVADSHDLLQARGVNGRRVVRQSWLIAGGMAGLGGMLLGMDTFVRPDLGGSVLLAMFAAVVVGGLGSPAGALVGAMILAFGQNLILFIDFGSLFGGDPFYLGSQYKQVFSFVFLVVILLVRPSGIFGEIEERV
jgi:branched-chain amino acid transport system permease protein